jgi:hypothetical protein
MTNKNKRTIKVSVKLEPGQAFVVADVAYFHHMIEVYRTLALDAETSDESLKWIEVADLIQHWIDETTVEDTVGYNDWD